MIAALVADDEPLLRSQLKGRLEALWPGLVVSEAANGSEALAAFDDDPASWPAVCFLDIHMPGPTGLDVARGIRERARRAGRRSPQLVFVTAFDAHALEAFEHGAIDYVLKPFETARLAETVERLRDRIASGHDAADADRAADALDALDDVALARLARIVSHVSASVPRRGTLQWIKASVGTTVRLIPVDDVQYFHADDKYTRVITQDGEALIRKPIKELVVELDASRFWQIHRATIVNTHAIAGVVRGQKDSADLRLKGRPETLTVSRAYLHLFRQM